MTWIFTVVALTAFLLQAAAEVAGDRLPDRRHRACAYGTLFVIGLVATILLVLGLAAIGRCVAKSRWWPEAIESQRQLFVSARFIVEHDGWRKDQLSAKGAVADPEKYRQANLENAETSISQIERLLELGPSQQSLRDRVARLTPHFSP